MTGDVTSVRRADAGDAPALARVELRSWRSAYRQWFPEGFLDAVAPEVRIEWWERTLEAGDPVTVVVEVDGVVSGYCVVSGRGDPPTTGEVVALYLDPDVWGRGHGRAVMERGIAELRAAGCSDAVVWVVDGNRRARSFYESVGWSPDGTVRPAPAFGPDVSEIRYRRWL